MKSALRAFKNEWNEYCEGERIVRELTSNDDEKPSVEQLQRLVYLIGAEPQNYQPTYMMIMKRVTDYRYLRHMEKGLIATEYLLKYGDYRFARSCKVHVKHFQNLKKYQYRLEGIDMGGNVRKRAARIVQLLENEEELEEARAQAQGLPKKKKVSKEERESSKGDDSSNIKPSTAKKQRKKKEEKEKEKEKEESKEKEEVKKPKVQMAPTEDLLGGDFNFTSNAQTDVASDDWLNGFVVDDKQFQNGGVGEDGGEFGFGASDDQNISFDDAEKDKAKEKESDPDAWLTQVTEMDNPLQELEKPQQKVNKKGKTMAQMQTKNDLAGKFDDSFLQTINSGLSGQPTSTQTSQPFNSDPFLFNNTNNSSVVGNPPVGTNQNATFTSINDPFRGLGSNQTTTNTKNLNGPIPATYQRSDKNDPFSNLSWK